MYQKKKKNNELMHYGVLGMKWGVRKDTQSSTSSTPIIDEGTTKIDQSVRYNSYLLSGHKRNTNVKSAKQAYKQGKINKAQYKNRVNKENTKRNKSMQKTEKYIANTDRYIKRQTGWKLEKEAKSTIPNYKLKLGAAKASNIVKTSGKTLLYGGTVLAGIQQAKINPALVPLSVGITAGAGAVITGAGKLAEMGIDKRL
jgi:hypothetical protein